MQSENRRNLQGGLDFDELDPFEENTEDIGEEIEDWN